ncbi:MAG: dihydrodipicolinate reductase [Pseudomonadota bacterium]
MGHKLTLSMLLVFCAGMASAEFAKVSDEAEFKAIVDGKTLTRPMVNLQVSSAGEITGKGLVWPVNGSWTWQNGYFCRDLNWGGDNLGYNCQEVRVKEGRIRFTSDQGRGPYADFQLKSRR